MQIPKDLTTIDDAFISGLTRQEKYQLAHILLDDAIDKLNDSYQRAIQETR